MLGIYLEKSTLLPTRALGFYGTNTMSGHRSGVQTCLRAQAPSAVYVHCRCHILQLAALNAGAEHTEVQWVLSTISTLLTIWKAFHYSQKKAEKLADIQAKLKSSSRNKNAEAQWYPLAVSWESYSCCTTKFTSTGREIYEEIYDVSGDAEAHGIATLLSKYKTVACIYMLSDLLYTVAKLQASLQSIWKILTGVPTKIKQRYLPCQCAYNGRFYNKTAERNERCKQQHMVQRPFNGFHRYCTTWLKKHSSQRGG